MTIDKEKLKSLAEAAIKQHQEWVAAGEPWPVWNRYLMELYGTANPAVILALLAEIERLTKFEDWFVRLDQVEQSLAASFKAERDQLKAENEDYKSGQERYEQIIEDLKAEIEALRKDAELLALGRAKLAGAMSRLRAKHNDWTAPEALPAAELVWCACGDGFPPNSYGAGFMDANNGVCWSCDAAKEAGHD